MKCRKATLVLSLAIILFVLAIAITATPVLADTALSITPASGPPGTLISIHGTGFSHPATYTLKLDTTTITTNSIIDTGSAAGTFNATYSLPSTWPRGIHNFTVTTSFVPAESAGPVTFTVTPIITANTSSGNVGDTISVNGLGFGASTSANIYFDDTLLSTAGSINTTGNGTFTKTFALPETYRGSHTISAKDNVDFCPDISFLINPNITSNPANAAVGSQVKVSGTGFTGSSSVTFTLDGIVNINAVANTNTKGSFSNTSVTIPLVSGGVHTLKATDGSGYSDTIPITATQSVAITPKSGPADTVITINGNGFAANKNIIITFRGTAINTSPAIITSDTNGNFTATIAAPKYAANAYDISASDGTNTGKSSFIISNTVKIDQTSGAVGSSIPVSGSGFTAGATVTIKYDGAAIATAIADANGIFSTTFKVPSGLAGQHKLIVTDGVNSITSNFTATASAQISNVNGTGSQISGNVGSDVTVSGDAFTPGATVSINYDSIQATTATVSADGSFSASFKAPTSKAGNHTVTASDGNNSMSFTFIMESTSPPAPLLISPQGDVKADALAKFQWLAVSDPSGVTYTLQISKDPGFNAIILQKTGLTSPGYQLTDREKLGSTGKDKPYYWRIKVVDGASNESPWSTAQTFVVGFIMPTWLLYFIYAIVGIVIFAVGFFLGRRSSGGFGFDQSD